MSLNDTTAPPINIHQVCHATLTCLIDRGMTSCRIESKQPAGQTDKSQPMAGDDAIWQSRRTSQSTIEQLGWYRSTDDAMNKNISRT